MLEQQDMYVMLNELSNTVVIERPEDKNFITKWQLACEGNFAHVVVMSHVSKDKLEAFVSELVASSKSKK
jgi:histidine decarboxylase